MMKSRVSPQTRGAGLKAVGNAIKASVKQQGPRQPVQRRASIYDSIIEAKHHIERWSKADWFMGTFSGQMAAIGMTGCFMLLVGALAIYSAEHSPGEAGPLHHNFQDCLWISWTYFVDPGTQTGLAGTDSGREKAIAVLCSMCGYTFFLSVMGIVVDLIRNKLDKWRVYRSRVVCNGHTLILGWTDKTLCMIEQLVEAMASEGGGQVVVLCDEKKTISSNEAAELIEYHFKRNPQRPKDSLRGTKVVCWEGEQTNTSDLMKVSVLSASSVIVMSGKGDLHDCDQHVIQTVMCLAGLGEAINGSIVAEVRFFDNKSILERIVPRSLNQVTGAEESKIKPILTSHIMNRLLVTMAISPSVGFSFINLLGFHGDDFYLKEWPQLTGKTFGEIGWLFDAAIPIGINWPAHVDSRTGKNVPARTVLNPSFDTVLEAGVEILVIAMDDNSYSPSAVADAENVEKWRTTSNNLKSAGILRSFSGPPQAVTGVAEVSEVASLVNTLVPTVQEQKKVVLLFGWRSDIVNILQILDKLLATFVESEVYILNEVPLAKRLDVFDEGGLTTAELPTSDPRAQIGRHSIGVGSMVIHHFFGDSTVRREINRLPVKHADVMLILSNDFFADAMYSDSNNITTLLLCKDIQRSSARQRTEAEQKGSQVLSVCSFDGSLRDQHTIIAKKKCVTVCEFSDPRTARIASSNPSLSEAAHFFPQNELVTQVFAMLSENPRMGAVLDTFLATEDQELFAVNISHIVADVELATQMSFWDLTLLARKKNLLLIGWRKPNDSAASASRVQKRLSFSHGSLGGIMNQICINPKDKAQKFAWNSEDQLLVIGDFGHAEAVVFGK